MPVGSLALQAATIHLDAPSAASLAIEPACELHNICCLSLRAFCYESSQDFTGSTSEMTVARRFPTDSTRMCSLQVRSTPFGDMRCPLMDSSRSEANSEAVFSGVILRDLENHFPEVFPLA